jgi:hypothetical protein
VKATVIVIIIMKKTKHDTASPNTSMIDGGKGLVAKAKEMHQKEDEEDDTHLPLRGPTFLGQGFQPSPNDVICARGARAYQHTGNARFRELVKRHMEQYSNANSNRLQKSRIVSRIVNYVRASSPGGGFVKETEKGQWFEVGDTASREKVGQGYV